MIDLIGQQRTAIEADKAEWHHQLAEVQDSIREKEATQRQLIDETSFCEANLKKVSRF